mgnify:CR=1 FL=1
MKHIASVMFMLLAGLLIYVSASWANCTGCGEDGHQMCPIENEKEVEAVPKISPSVERRTNANLNILFIIFPLNNY